MFKLDLEKADEPEIKLPALLGSSKKQESSRKPSTSALLTTPKPLTLWITTNWKILKEMGILDHLTCLLRNFDAGREATIRNEHGKTDWFQIMKGVHQHCILSPCFFNLYQSTSGEMPGWMKHKLESRLPGEISITSEMQMTPPYGRKWRTKELLDESERVGLKLNIQKTEIMASGPITSWQIDEETVETVTDLFWGAPKSLLWWLQPRS